MPDHDTILAVLQSGIGLAGLLLIFSGFLVTKAATFETRRGDKFRYLAIGTLAPVLATLVLSWMGVMALEGSSWAGHHLLTMLKISLALTAIFAIVGILATSS